MHILSTTICRHDGLRSITVLQDARILCILQTYNVLEHQKSVHYAVKAAMRRCKQRAALARATDSSLFSRLIKFIQYSVESERELENDV